MIASTSIFSTPSLKKGFQLLLFPFWIFSFISLGVNDSSTSSAIRKTKLTLYTALIKISLQTLFSIIWCFFRGYITQYTKLLNFAAFVIMVLYYFWVIGWKISRYILSQSKKKAKPMNHFTYCTFPGNPGKNKIASFKRTAKLVVSPHEGLNIPRIPFEHHLMNAIWYWGIKIYDAPAARMPQILHI